MAAASDSTPAPRKRDPVYEAHLARAFTELETPLYDLRHASYVLELLNQHVLTPMSEESRAELQRYRDPDMRWYRLTVVEAEALDYSMTLIGDLARSVVAKYEADSSEAHDARTTRREASNASKGFSPELTKSQPESVDLFDLEEPLRTAMGHAAALRLMAINPVGENEVEAEPVFILARNIEASLKLVEERWTACIEQTRAAA